MTEQNDAFVHHQALILYVSTIHNLSRDDEELITGSFRYEKIRKNTVLEKENSIAKKLYFIIDGFIRIYLQKYELETTTQILGKHQLATAFESFVHSTKSEENVKSITDCNVLSISKENYLELYSQSEGWRTFCKYSYERIIEEQKTRTKKLLTMSAEQRYIDLLDTQPELVKMVPIQYLSSYIGIKPESLSRIRRKIIS